MCIKLIIHAVLNFAGELRRIHLGQIHHIPHAIKEGSCPRTNNTQTAFTLEVKAGKIGSCYLRLAVSPFGSSVFTDKTKCYTGGLLNM